MYSQGRDGLSGDSSSGDASSDHGRWHAPQNPQAYCARDVYCSAEDMAGEPVGTFVIARGRYLWTPEEEFPLFLQSLLRCSGALLDTADRKTAQAPGAGSGRVHPQSGERRQKAQAELAYLLAQQFVDARTALAYTAHCDPTAQTCTLRAALELEPGARLPSGDAPLYPDALRSHRLYLKNAAGHRLGYLSFPDDRLYYIVLPLFEQRRVQVRITVRTEPAATSDAGPAASVPGTGVRAHRSRLTGRRSCPLELQMRFLPELPDRPESLRLQIEQLLAAYVQ